MEKDIYKSKKINKILKQLQKQFMMEYYSNLLESENGDELETMKLLYDDFMNMIIKYYKFY